MRRWNEVCVYVAILAAKKTLKPICTFSINIMSESSILNVKNDSTRSFEIFLNSFLISIEVRRNQ